MSNPRLLPRVCLLLGTLGLFAEFAGFFPSKSGATGVMGAVLFSAGVIARSLIEARGIEARGDH